MWSLDDIRQKNRDAVARTNPERLDDVWSESQSVTLPGRGEAESVHPRTEGRILFTSEVVLAFAELGLGYNFNGLRRGLTAVLRAERGTPDVELEPLTVFAFALATAPELVAEWTEALEAKVARYRDCPDPSFTILDHAHGGIRIRVVNGVVEKILPPRRQQSRSLARLGAPRLL